MRNIVVFTTATLLFVTLLSVASAASSTNITVQHIDCTPGKGGDSNCTLKYGSNSSYCCAHTYVS